MPDTREQRQLFLAKKKIGSECVFEWWKWWNYPTCRTSYDSGEVILPVGLFEPIADRVVLPVHVHLVPLLLVDVRSDLMLRSDMFTLVSNKSPQKAWHWPTYPLIKTNKFISWKVIIYSPLGELAFLLWGILRGWLCWRSRPGKHIKAIKGC